MKVTPHPQWEDKGTYKEPIPSTDKIRVPRLEVDNATTYIDKDGSNNLTITDAVTGTKTLAELSGGGDVTAAANLTDNAIVRGDGGAKGIQTTGITIDDSDDIIIGAYKIKTTNCLLKELDSNGVVLKNTADNGYRSLTSYSLYYYNMIRGLDTSCEVNTCNSDNSVLLFKATDNDGAEGAQLEVAKLTSANDPYFSMGGSQQGKFYYSGYFTIDGNFHILGQNELRFYEGANYVGFEAPALDADQIWVLPNADGNADQILKTDGGGNLGWANPSGGGDMLAATYDPTTIAASAFDTDNHIDGSTNGVYTLAERTKLAGVATGADVTGSNTCDTPGGAGTDTTAVHVNTAMAENETILLDSVMSADGKYSTSEAFTGTAGANLAFGQVVYLDGVGANNKWELAKGDAETTLKPLTATVIIAANEDATVTLMRRGILRTGDPGYTVGAPLFISAATAGLMTETELTTGQFQKVVGFAMTADQVYVDHSQDWIKVG